MAEVVAKRVTAKIEGDFVDGRGQTRVLHR